MEQNNLFIHRMEDLANKANKTGCTISRFLTPAEAMRVAEYFKYKDISLSLDGGYDGAERVRAVFLNPEWGEYHQEEFFTALKIEHRPQDSLSHRDILGAVMALGIERDTLGDIISEEHSAVLICLPELGKHIADNLTKAGRVGVKISMIGLNELPVKQEELTIKTDTVASLRLDAVLSSAFSLSRAKAAELITSGRVNINHLPCLQPAKELEEGSLLSVHGMGRAKLAEVGGISRKGRVIVKIGLYGK